MNLDLIPQYELIEERKIEDLDSYSYLLRHKKSGARVAILENDDTNKVFYIGFRTPPKDSTGVAHILEHSVLCGSSKYPLKDPFVELAKGSLNTFLNAMTYPDKTVYPIASCNDQDFKNLMDIYLDAVFHPNIYNEKKIFMQEGWHYEMDNADSELKLSGVVYSEMKGAFSSPDDVLQREIMNSLYPDTAYGVESGGDPKNIPDLTYENFLEFHKTYYHPANSYIYLYGNADMAERLAYIDKEYLSKYDEISVESFPGEQKPFDEPKLIVKEYPITEDENEENNTYLSYNAVCDVSLNKELYIAMQIVDYALVDAQGTPVKKALLEAGIGNDIYATYENGIYQPYYSIVAKNANASDKDRFVAIIEDTLKKVVKEGIDKNALLAGLNVLEFKYREADFGTNPKGLFLGLYAMDSWLYDDSKPFASIECNDTYKFLREMIDTDYYEKIVEKYLINNVHKSIVVVEPKKGLTSKNEADLANKLSAYKASLSDDEIQAIVDNTKALLEYQETPDSEEVIAKIPKLKREDLDKKAQPLYNEEIDVEGIKCVHHNVFTNGIAYVNVLFKADNVPEKMLPVLNMLQYVIGGVDTDKYTYEVLGYEIDKNTGNMYGTIQTITDAFDSSKYSVYFSLKIKAFADNMDKAFEIGKEMILNSHLDDKKRLKEIISEVKSRIQAKLMSSGHLVAANRIISYVSEYGSMLERLYGVESYRFMENLEKNFDQEIDGFIETVKLLTEHVFNKKNVICDVTVSGQDFEKVSKLIPEFINSFNGKSADFAPVHYEYSKKNEGFTSSAQVNYVAKGGDFKKAGHVYTGALRILKTILGYEYLWNEVRVKGNAYGCMSSFSRSGECFFVSYRDPNLARTVDVFNKAPEFIRNFKADEEGMTKFIIGTLSDMDIPFTPRIKGERSFAAYMSGLTFGHLQRERDEILNASDADIRRLADLVQAFLSEDTLCVVGNEDAIKNEKDSFGQVVALING